MSNAGAGFVSGEKNGNVISPKGSNHSGGSTVTEELSEGDIREKRVLGEKEDLVVSELSSGGKVRERDSDEHAVKIEIDSLEAQDRLNKWFDTEELSAMSEGRDLIEGRESPDHDKTWREALKEEVEAKNRELAKEKKRKEIEETREEMKKYTKYDTSIQELKGGEFQELIQEANGDGSTDPEGFEEVKKKIEAKYEPMIDGGSDTEIKDPNDSVENLSEATEAWREYAESEGSEVWEEMARDLEESDHKTEYTTLSENSRRVKTTEEEMKKALRNPESEPVENISVEIEEDTGDTIIAVVSEN